MFITRWRKMPHIGFLDPVTFSLQLCNRFPHIHGISHDHGIGHKIQTGSPIELIFGMTFVNLPFIAHPHSQIGVTPWYGKNYTLRVRIDSISMTSLFFCKINQAAAFLRKSSGKATSLRHKDAAMICFPRSVTLHLCVRGILAINL